MLSSLPKIERGHAGIPVVGRKGRRAIVSQSIGADERPSAGPQLHEFVLWQRATTAPDPRFGPRPNAGRVQARRVGHLCGLVLGATDRRLKCIVAQVPTISGYEQGLRRVPPDGVAALNEAFAEDERAQFRGEPPRRQAVVSADPNTPAAYRSPEAVALYTLPVPDGAWDNEMTLRSTAAARAYEPGVWVSRVAPTPLLMVVATRDTITLTDLALAAYERALEPKRLCLVEGGHFDPYLSQFATSSDAAVTWFRKHLQRPEQE